MKLRALVEKDAPLMLEWMHDKNVTRYLSKPFGSNTLSDCINFISENASPSADADFLNLAIASDEGEYMGTVSLKNIDRLNAYAEFAIVVRPKAMGKGFSWYGMREIIKIGFEKYGLKHIYWCVDVPNLRAVSFYNKHKFSLAKNVPSAVKDHYRGQDDLLWYEADEKDFIEKCLFGCRIISIRTVPTEGKGCLHYVESLKDVPFDIKRIYYITDVPKNVERGSHAHRTLKQLLFCPYGNIRIILNNGSEETSVDLDKPGKGLIITSLIWRNMIWTVPGSVLCVAASDYYDEKDYIRSYSAFRNYLKGKQ